MMWRGQTSPQGVSLEQQFAARASQARIDEGAEVPTDAASWITPLTVTGAAIEYSAAPHRPQPTATDRMTSSSACR